MGGSGQVRVEATKDQKVNFHEELEVCVPWVGQALLGAIFWQAGNKINCSYESESFSVHIVSFICFHVQLLIRPVRREYLKGMLCN